jgi:hypothetical protein
MGRKQPFVGTARLGWVIIRVSFDLLRHRAEVVIARVREALRAAGCTFV